MAGGCGETQPLTPGENLVYSLVVIALILMSGLMSGLTLGLMSLDSIELEVLMRTGTSAERKWAQRVLPVIGNPHQLLCSLLLCNSACMEALPIFMDKLVDTVVAIIISTTAILFFGEIIPQAVCSRCAPCAHKLSTGCSTAAEYARRTSQHLLGIHGWHQPGIAARAITLPGAIVHARRPAFPHPHLMPPTAPAHARRYGIIIGGFFAPFVRLLMIITWPISWPLGKLLDLILGTKAGALLGRRQLKALVDLHHKDAGEPQGGRW
jgi:CBS domain containing-hemolysin-like protein